MFLVANTKQTKLVDLEDKVIFAAVHPMMHTILLLTQSSSHIYSVLRYQTETGMSALVMCVVSRVLEYSNFKFSAPMYHRERQGHKILAVPVAKSGLEIGMLVVRKIDR